MSKKQQKLQRRLQDEQNNVRPVSQIATPDDNKWGRIQALIVFLLAIVLYANTVGNNYAVDDTIVITKNKLTTQGFAGIGKIMTTDAFYGFFGEDYKFVAGGRYRPLSIVTFAIEYQFFGLNPHISHLINILLYALTCLLVLKVLQEIFNHPKYAAYALTVPFVAALIYTAHPIHTEVVANIKGRDEIMGMLGSVLALYLCLLYVKRQNFLFLIGAFVAFIFALFSKENSITYLAVIPLTLYYFTNAKAKDYAFTIGPVVILAALFVLLRAKFTPVDITAESQEILNNPFVRATVGERFATVAFTFWEYIRLLILPHPLTYDYYYNQVPIIGWDSPKAIVPALINLGILAYGVIQLPKKTHISWAILYYFITISIVSNILFTVGIAMNERFVFMPSLGFAVIMAVLLVKVTNYIKANNWGYVRITNPMPLLVIVGVILAGYSAKTITRNMDWKNDFVLFAADVKNSPESAKVANAYGGELVTAADTAKAPAQVTAYLKEAEKQLERALKIYPEYQNALLLLGNARYKLYKDVNKVIPLYQRTLAQNPNYFEGNFNLGTVLLENERAAEAIPYLKKAVLSKPDKIESRYNLAEAYSKAGLADSAIMVYNELAVMQPGNALPMYKIGAVYGRVKNDLNNSILYLEKAIAMDPKQVLYYEDLGVAYGMKGDFAGAIAAVERGVQVDPKYAPFYWNIGISYKQMGNEAKASEYFAKAAELDPAKYGQPQQQVPPPAQ